MLQLRHRDGPRTLKARIRLEGSTGEVLTDLSRPIAIALDLNFSADQPRHFGAPAATSHAFAVPGFSGSVATGASCNCNVITLIPHCNGTHTESVGHLTTERLDAHRQAPLGLIPAVLATVEPVDARDSTETTEPAPQPGDELVTRRALEQGWPRTLPFQPKAVVIRTLPNDSGKKRRDYTDSSAPYLSREAAEFLVSQGIEHLVIDLPSIDRSHDEGRLTAHRVFFGLPRGATSLDLATRSRSTVTELAYIPTEVADGAYLLEIQVPAIGGDAVPSRPLLYLFEQL
jgi:kynurenine formamidase